MTTNQTIDGVPGLRSLLERVTSQDLGMSAKKARAQAAHELRALLDAPANVCEDLQVLREMKADADSLGETMDDESLAELAALEAAQPQGEPVHQCQKCWGHGVVPTRRAGEGETSYRNRCKLYANPPAPVAPTPINYGALDPVERLAVCRGEVAPVAVVMPERRADIDSDKPELLMAVASWNACLDDLKRLNPSL